MPMQKSSIDYPKRGDIFIADLDPPFGQEIHKKRPVVVVSSNSINQTLPIVIIIPLSSIVPQFLGPDMVEVAKIKGLDKPSVIVVHYIRAIDKVRLIKKIGRLTKQKFAEVKQALKLVLEIEQD